MNSSESLAERVPVMPLSTTSPSVVARLAPWTALLIALALPMFASDYLLRAVLIPFLILGLAALGLNVLVGYCGQMSLGTGAFMAVGAYGAFNLITRVEGMPLILAILAGGLCATVIGLLFGIPSLRVRGLYLAVATLAAQFFVDWAALRIGWLTAYSPSGSVSVSQLQVFGQAIATPAQRYLLCLVFVVAFVWIVRNLVRSRNGRSWMAIRDMDVAAMVLGLHPARAKFSAFAVSSFIVGVAGALWGFVHLGAWEPATFNIDRSLQALFMVIIGGLGSLSGAFLGAAFIIVLPLLLDQLPHLLGLNWSTTVTAHITHITLGALIVIFLIAEPHGLARLWRDAIASRRISATVTAT